MKRKEERKRKRRKRKNRRRRKKKERRRTVNLLWVLPQSKARPRVGAIQILQRHFGSVDEAQELLSRLAHSRDTHLDSPTKTNINILKKR